MTGSALASRPNDGTGFWPDSSNTGYQNAPDYPGQLTDFPPNYNADLTYLDGSYDGQTIKFKRFRGKVMIGTTSGSDPSSVAHINFYGCLFEGNLPQDILVYDFTTAHSTYTYSTFKPLVSAPPVSCADSYEISWNQSGTGAVTMDHCDLWGGAGIQFGTSSQAKPLIFTNNYIHDEADPDNTGGCNYHHDGFGPCSEGGISYVTIDHNTIASRGNTNGVALQGTNPYDHITITNNYISGWGYAVAIGAGNTAASDTNINISGNIFSGQLSTLYGPYYANIPPGPGSTWTNNRYQIRAGDAWGNTSQNGQYWWPTDIDGHASDYP